MGLTILSPGQPPDFAAVESITKNESECDQPW